MPTLQFDRQNWVSTNRLEINVKLVISDRSILNIAILQISWGLYGLLVAFQIMELNESVLNPRESISPLKITKTPRLRVKTSAKPR